MPQVTLFEHQQVGWEELGWTEDSPYPDLLESLNESVGDSLIVLGHKTLKATQYVGIILEIFDEMQQAIDKGEPYQTHLDPPPADADGGACI